MAGLAAPDGSAGPDKSPDRIARMFDAIARRYDLLNHLLSLGIDRSWRRRAVQELQLRSGDRRVLDLCTGTADLALAALEGLEAAHAQQSTPDLRVVGVDFAAEMLRWARVKIARRGEAGVVLVRGDAMQIPLSDGSVDAATIGFGIRNVARPERAARELVRVLRPGGRVAILEFGTPRTPGLRAAYLFYFRRILPLIGRIVSRHDEAYSYLPASVAAFQTPDDFLSLLRTAGFTEARVVPLTLGIVYLFVAVK